MKKAETVCRQIYKDLRKQIISGELSKGQRLVETRIAAQYEINKVHVRDALHMLERDNLISYVPMKGFFVLGISKERLLELAKLREVLESTIFDDFLTNAADEDIEAAKLFTQRKIALLKGGLKSEAFKETRATFEVVYRCTVYQYMVSILRQCQEYIDLMIIKAFDAPDDVEKTIRNSTLLYEVLDKRDRELSQKWIHIRYVNAVSKLERSRLYA